MRSHVFRWLAIPALVAGMALPSTAWAQTQQPSQSGQVPSVGVTPVSTSPNDPNGVLIELNYEAANEKG